VHGVDYQVNRGQQRVKLRNATERVVRETVDRKKPAGSTDSNSGCCCPLCESDVMALSLGSLSPHYCTDFDYEKVLGGEESSRVDRTVDHSIARVALHPKHERLAEDVSDLQLRLVNFSCKEGKAIIDSLLEDSDDSCSCPRCRAETLAYALNRYPPRYGVERNGIVEMPARERAAIREEITTILTRANQVVTASPRHGHS
jgi:hypothetical protein